MRTSKIAIAEKLGAWHTVWLCDCCMYAHHYAEHHCDPSDHAEPLSLLADMTGDFFDGLPMSEHADGCTEADREERCDCVTREFTYSACDGCGQGGGRRHAFTNYLTETIADNNRAFPNLTTVDGATLQLTWARWYGRGPGSRAAFRFTLIRHGDGSGRLTVTRDVGDGSPAGHLYGIRTHEIRDVRWFADGETY